MFSDPLLSDIALIIAQNYEAQLVLHSPTCTPPQALARDVQNIAEEAQLRRPFSGWVIRLASLAGRLCLSHGMELGLHAPFEYAMVLWCVGLSETSTGRHRTRH